jgi:hypothetical protein
MEREQETTTLYRPTGEQELALIQASGYTAFPPRSPWQPQRQHDHPQADIDGRCQRNRCHDQQHGQAQQN